MYRDYLVEGYSVRFMYKDMILPNIEVKIARSGTRQYAISYSIEVLINNKAKIKISPIELQIAYKLKLGSEKNVSDTLFLYILFKEYIDRGKLEKWRTVLQVNTQILEEVNPP